MQLKSQRRTRSVYSSFLKKFDEVVMLMATSGSPGWTLTLYILAVTFHPLFKEFRMMKKFLVHGALAMAVVCGGATAYAQMGGQGGGGGSMVSISPCLPSNG